MGRALAFQRGGCCTAEAEMLNIDGKQRVPGVDGEHA